MSDNGIDVGLIDPILQEFREQKGAVIPILQRTQDIYGYLPEDAMHEISKRSGISISQLYGVATFYSQFNLEPRGRHNPNLRRHSLPRKRGPKIGSSCRGRI